ncbi:MAG: hypothetical protein OEX07_14555, partial [Gammaproteobacteria bacterium]|nr:hypothetical protein [Gammaproteobacteria bacterium]
WHTNRNQISRRISIKPCFLTIYAIGLNLLNTHHCHPKFYVLANFTAILISFYLFSFFSDGNIEEYFFLPLVLLAVFWSIINFFFQHKTESKTQQNFYVDHQSKWINLLKRAIPRYLVWLVIFFSALQLFQSPYFFISNEKTNLFLSSWFEVYLYSGIPYFVITLKYKASRTEDFYDPAVRFIHIIKQIILSTTGRKKHLPAFHVMKKDYNKKVLLNLVMRGYFIPVMVGGIYPLLMTMLGRAENNFHNLNFFVVTTWIIAMLWLADTLSAATGYCMESRWTESRSRSIDLTIGGWLVCLCCYPPLNQVTSSLFAFAPDVITNNVTDLIIPHDYTMYLIRIVEISLLLSLVICDLSLGPSGVNITFKKLQNKGPYGLVRHPATTSKLSFWWLQSCLYVPFWHWEVILGQLAWSTIYILRTLSEEKHLKNFPEYRQYMKEVKYRFIPGII